MPELQFFKKLFFLELFNSQMTWVPGDPSAIFLATSFIRKTPEGSDSMFSYIFMTEKIWYHNFTWSGQNAQEVANFVPI